jgi:hypothetical protein
MNAEKHGMRGGRWQVLRRVLKAQEENLENLSDRLYKNFKGYI